MRATVGKQQSKNKKNMTAVVENKKPLAGSKKDYTPPASAAPVIRRFRIRSSHSRKTQKPPSEASNPKGKRTVVVMH